MTTQHRKPSLFGLNHSNRDFSKKASWGKNQFNNAFPAALACYLALKGLDLGYLTLDHNLTVHQTFVSVEGVLGQPYHL